MAYTTFGHVAQTENDIEGYLITSGQVEEATLTCETPEDFEEFPWGFFRSFVQAQNELEWLEDCDKEDEEEEPALREWMVSLMREENARESDPSMD